MKRIVLFVFGFDFDFDKNMNKKGNTFEQGYALTKNKELSLFLNLELRVRGPIIFPEFLSLRSIII